MPETPKSSIDWQRSFTLPVAVPHNHSTESAENDMPVELSDYFTSAAMDASVISGPTGNDGIAYQRISGKNNLFPGYCNVPDLVEDGPTTSAAGSRLVGGGVGPGSLAASSEEESTAAYHNRVCADNDSRAAGLLPMPWSPDLSLHVAWKSGSAALNSEMGDDDFISDRYYMRTTDSTRAGELDPKLIRALTSGII